MSTRTLGHRPTFDLTTRSAPVLHLRIGHFSLPFLPDSSPIHPLRFTQLWDVADNIVRRRSRVMTFREILFWEIPIFASSFLPRVNYIEKYTDLNFINFNG